MAGRPFANLIVVVLAPVLSWTACTTTESGQPPGFPAPLIPFAPETYVAYRGEESIEVDGKLDEDAWAAAQWTAEFVDIEGPTREVPRLGTRVKMLWDDEFFYVGAAMEEPHVWGVLRDRDAVIYHDNDFEIFIDPDGDTHEYYELEINALGTEWDLFLVRPYRDGGPAINAWDIQGLKTAVHVNGTLNDPSDRDSGWSVEMALPWDVLGQATRSTAPPEGGDQWRVNYSRVQWRAETVDGRYVKLDDTPPGRTRPEDNWVWSAQGLINMHYPEMWGMVQFSESAVGVGEEVATLRELDLVKWALRQVYYAQRAWFNMHGEYSDDLTELHLGHIEYQVELWATPRLFEASIVLGGQPVRIREDGRVW
jgi:hypothetical protein